MENQENSAAHFNIQILVTFWCGLLFNQSIFLLDVNILIVKVSVEQATVVQDIKKLFPVTDNLRLKTLEMLVVYFNQWTGASQAFSWLKTWNRLKKLETG